MTHIGLIEPGYYTRQAYGEYLASFPGFIMSFAATGTSDPSFTAFLAGGKPLDILIYGMAEMDLVQLSGCYGGLKNCYPNARVIVLSNCTDPAQLAALMRMGVHGHVMRSHRMQHLIQALDEVRQGAAALCGQSVLLLRRFFCEEAKPLTGPFTQRETELLGMVCSGASIPHIAHTLQLSTTTVNYHLQKLYKRFKVGSRAELMAAAGIPKVSSFAIAS